MCVEDWSRLGKAYGENICLLLAGCGLLWSFAGWPAPFAGEWLAIILCGTPIIVEAVTALARDRSVKSDLLVAIALVGAVLIGENFAAGEVAFIMQLGERLEEFTLARARAGIEKLARLTPETARVLDNDDERVVVVDDVRRGDLLRVLPGECVPVDGVITFGQTTVNEAVLTGESLPVDKKAGDNVFSGTVNQFGVFEMRAEKVGADSSLQRMLRLVEQADAGKTQLVSVADKWAGWIVAAALTAAVAVWAVTGEIIRAVTVLVVFCPCALVLATPTAIMAAVGNAARNGLLVREGDALEKLGNIKKFVFDKTGTITFGRLRVEAVRSLKEGISQRELFAMAASCEAQSEHPLGKAVVRCWRETAGALPALPQNFRMLPGRGVQAVIGGKIIIAGNLPWLQEQVAAGGNLAEAAQPYLAQGCTVIYLAVDGEAAGIIALMDTVRPQAGSVVGGLRDLGIGAALLTGDNGQAASCIAQRVGIDEVKSGCLPEDKLAYISDAASKGEAVCMVGDGVNDAPALKSAYVGIAMGGVGSDITTEAADIVLVDDNIKALPHLVQLSKKMLQTIKRNTIFSMTLNFAAVLLAVTGLLNPIFGALIHNAGSVLVIINSACLLRWREPAAELAGE